MTTELYYTAPDEDVFNEVKKRAIELWIELRGKYHAEKTGYVSKIQNIKDNIMTIIAMFDISNQGRLADKLSDEAKKEINKRIVDGQGYDSIFI